MKLISWFVRFTFIVEAACFVYIIYFYKSANFPNGDKGTAFFLILPAMAFSTLVLVWIRKHQQAHEQSLEAEDNHRPGIIDEKVFPVRYRWYIKLVCLLIPTFFSWVYRAKQNNPDNEGWYYFIATILTSISLYLIGYYLTHRTFHYSLEDEYFRVRQGVFNEKGVFASGIKYKFDYLSIRDTYVKQDLLDIILGIATLKISFSVDNAQPDFNKKRDGVPVGVHSKGIDIPGLKRSDAEQVKNKLKLKIQDKKSQNI